MEQRTHQTIVNGLVFWGLICLGSSLKLWLVSGQDVAVFGNAIYDDRLFVELAQSLLHGNWLGEYDHLTLIKGPFYPLFIAGSSVLGIPLSVSEHIFYICACILLILALFPLVNNRLILLAAFFFVLFNPASYDAQVMPRLIRDGIYLTLTLACFACLIGLFVRIQGSLRIFFLWSCLLGCFLSFLWLTREEGIWILPSCIFITILSLYKIIVSIKESKITRILLILFPYFILINSILVVSTINYNYYGIFAVVEVKTNAFQSAYNALSRVRDDGKNRYLHAPKAMREKLYRVSPSLARIKPHLEGEVGGKWQNMLCAASKNAENLQKAEQQRYRQLIDVACADIAGGWFLWAFRDAVAAQGFHSSPRKAMTYYDRVAQEISAACGSQKITCYPERVSLAPRLSLDDVKPLLQSASAALEKILFFQGISIEPYPSIGSSQKLDWISNFIRDNVSDVSNTSVGDEKVERNYKIGLLKILAKNYVQIYTLLIIASIIAFIFFLLSKYRNTILSILGTSVCIAILTRIFLLSYIDIASFPALTVNYISPLYILCNIFIIINSIYLYLLYEIKK